MATRKRLLWHPAVHAREQETLRFGFVTSYKLFSDLQRNTAPLDELTGDRLGIYFLWGKEDILLKFWATDETFSRVNAYLMEKAGREPMWLEVKRPLKIGFAAMQNLKGAAWLQGRSADDLAAIQNRWERTARVQPEERNLCVSANRFDTKEQVKAFLTIDAGTADLQNLVDYLLQDANVFGLYSTQGTVNILVEIETGRGDSLWHLSNTIQGHLQVVPEARTTTYPVAHLLKEKSHRCGFESSRDRTVSHIRRVERMFPGLKSLELKDLLQYSRDLVDWLPLIEKAGGLKTVIVDLVNSAMKSDRTNFSNGIIEIGRKLEIHFRKTIPQLAQKLFPSNWQENLRLADPAKRERTQPELWTLGIQLEILGRDLASVSGLAPVEFSVLYSFASLHNDAKHQGVEPSAARLATLLPVLRILVSRPADFGFNT